ncbi:hypothetical protein HMPREF0971_00959, partial [Segatella oris F0302]
MPPNSSVALNEPIINTFLIVVDNVTGGLSGFCHQVGMRTKRENLNNFLKSPLSAERQSCSGEEEEELQ